MRIMVVNDDGIESDGIRRLAGMAAELGEVWVVAPRHQCSAMSHCITVRGSLHVKEESFPVPGVKAYSVDGTPVDCVKVGIKYLLPQKPDIVFSGINFGYNVGADILYSGTVGAAMEALLNGIPAIAFSEERGGSGAAADTHLLPVVRKLLAKEIAKDEIWNVNFPGCPPEELQGIRENRIPDRIPFSWMITGWKSGKKRASAFLFPAKQHRRQERERIWKQFWNGTFPLEKYEMRSSEAVRMDK